MSSQNRREFLKRTGGVVGAGGALAAGGLTAAEHASSRPVAEYITSVEDGLPPLRGPYADEDWVEYRSGPGNAASIPAAADLDPDGIECTCFYDGEHVGDQGAVVGDAMYVAGGGRVRALDARDGSVRWTSDDVGASGAPAVAYDRVVSSGGGDPVVALDVEDGSLDWESDLEGLSTAPTVAYETVYVVAGGSLYALDVTDGSVRWKRRPDADGAEFWARPPAASYGHVYAIVNPDGGTRELVALGAATGERLWGDEWSYTSGLAATEERVTASSGRASERFRVLDAGTGEPVAASSGVTVPALDDEALVTILDWELTATFFDDRDGWTLGDFSTGALGYPTIAGDTVFVYVGDDHQEEYARSLLAIDKYEGAVEWTCDVDAGSEGLGTNVVATGDAVYVFGDEAIHVVHESTDGHEH